MKKIIVLLCACLAILQVGAQTKKKAVGKKTTFKKVVLKSKSTAVKYPVGTTILPSGIAFKKIINGTGKLKPQIDDQVMMHIRAYVSDSMLFDSYKLNNNEPVPAKISKPQFNGDIMDAITMLVEGDSAVMYVPQDSIFRNGMKPPFAIPGDLVFYQIKMISVKNAIEFEKEQKEIASRANIIDDEKIATYIKANNLVGVKKTSSGLYYQITEEGKGDLVPVGKEVTMNYTGYLLDGTVFDSNIKEEFQHVQPFKFALGKGQVIKGWDEGVALLNKGAKAKLLIPSSMAYGSQARPGLPANSVLIFDVQLVDF
jgi:FKBP-type peptidyl-prolyl cis-trans isomerase FkpA